MRLPILLASAVAIIALPGMAVARVWATDAMVHPAAKGGPPTAAYLVLHNNGAKAVKLVGVDCGCARMVMAHRSSEQGGMAHMEEAGPLEVPPHGRLIFAPGGLHLMVMDLKHDLKLGQTARMALRLDGAKPLSIAFRVQR